MARGWESKSVEAQVESAADRQKIRRPELTPEEREAERRRDSLLLQRTRILQEIERSTNERHRATLSGALDFLETELKSGGWNPQ